MLRRAGSLVYKRPRPPFPVAASPAERPSGEAHCETQVVPTRSSQKKAPFGFSRLSIESRESETPPTVPSSESHSRERHGLLPDFKFSRPCPTTTTPAASPSLLRGSLLRGVAAGSTKVQGAVIQTGRGEPTRPASLRVASTLRLPTGYRHDLFIRHPRRIPRPGLRTFDAAQPTRPRAPPFAKGRTEERITQNRSV